jgi:DMSO/TMAO reductase YedYZ molybdopterin-dependent catalytic subunit
VASPDQPREGGTTTAPPRRFPGVPRFSDLPRPPLVTDPSLGLHQGPYRSPLRDERLAAWLGSTLGVLFTVCFITGIYSHLQQHPVSWFPIPAGPAGLYRVTQGIHVAFGIASMPVLAAKLWVVWPRLLSLPPFRRVSDVVERLGVLALVGGGIFMVFTGIADVAQWYPWRFSFEASHYWVAWITIGAIVAHIGAKWATTRRALRRKRNRPALEAADPVLGTEAEGVHDGLTRRGFLGAVVAASATLTAVTVGQTLPALRRFAVLAPRKPGDRPINRSAANAGVIRSAQSASYRLTVTGRVGHPLTFSLAELLALPAHEVELPISCVEGWSWSGRWGGVRMRDLLSMAGAAPDAAVRVESLERHSIYRTAFVDHFQAHASNTLLATHLDGEPLSLDHGYPLRLIGPDRPGVIQTKWVTSVVVL